MKVLSNTQVQQVSGGFNIGSLMSFLGMKTTGAAVHALEQTIYGVTVGLIPVLGTVMKDFLTDAFGQFKTEAPEQKPEA